MLATPGALPDGPAWTFEVKWDGMRVLADVVDGVLRLSDRAGRDMTSHFPELAGVGRLAPDLLLDGEVVLLERGVPSFAALADRMHGPVDPQAAVARPVTYMVFDVLRLYGVDLRERPLEERRATLRRMAFAAVPTVTLSPIYTDGPALFAATAQQGMEGVLAKRRDAPYREGRDGGDWVAVSHRRTQACVVGGWRPERGAVTRIGALLLGVPTATGLRYVGRVDTGLGSDVAQRLLGLRLATTDVAPFAEPVPNADVPGVRWCVPHVVVEVSHAGWTPDGRLRTPVFRGIRDDLDPGQVHIDP